MHVLLTACVCVSNACAKSVSRQSPGFNALNAKAPASIQVFKTKKHDIWITPVIPDGQHHVHVPNSERPFLAQPLKVWRLLLDSGD